MEWSEDLAIGVLEVDIQHKLLIENFNAFLAACYAGVGAEKINQMFWFLQGYAATHFRDEEKLMLETGYPDYQKHKAQHLEFTAEVGKMTERLKKEGPTDALVSELSQYVNGWLVKHISYMDRAIGLFIAKSRK